MNEYKNIFECIVELGHCEWFDTTTIPTDQPTISFDATSTLARNVRVQQLAERVERGEMIFHPDEANVIVGKESAGRTFIETARGYTAGSGCVRPSRAG